MHHTLITTLIILLWISPFQKCQKLPPAVFDIKEDLARLALEDKFPLNFTLNDQGIEFYRQQLAETGDAEIEMQLAIQLLMAGSNEEAIEIISKKIEEFSANPDMPAAAAYILYHLRGVAYQRMAETQNCRTNHHASSCIYPFDEHAVYKDPVLINSAIQNYLKALELNADDQYSKWMLNICYVSLGKYPIEVPKEYLIDLNKYDSPYESVKFKDLAPALGLDAFGWLGGTVMADFNNDGFEDIFLTSYKMTDNVRLFYNYGNKGFTESTEAAGLSGIIGGAHTIPADYNNDGFMDIFIVRGGWMKGAGKWPNSLLKNNGNNTFTDVTKEAGLLSYYQTHTAAWADINNDGFLDLFVGNEKWADSVDAQYSELFLNRKNGTFKNISKEAGVVVDAFVKGAVFGDINNDGFQDLYISCFGQPNLLFLNDGLKKGKQISFTNIAKEAGVEEPLFSFPCMFFDFDNDGDEDLFVAGYYIDDVELASEYLDLQKPQHPPKLYRNNGDLSFSDVTDDYGLQRSIFAMGLNFSDIDNDGWQDFYAATGWGDLRALWPNLMFKNIEGEKFADVTAYTRTGHLQKGHSVSFGDINHDGQLDMYLNLGGFVYDDRFTNALFYNVGSENNWVGLVLEGVKANRSAIGSRIKISFEENGKQKIIYRTVTTGSSYGANSLEMIIGLGAAEKIKELEITWAGSQTSQRFSDIEIRKFYSLKEGRSLVLRQKVFIDMENMKGNPKHDHRAHHLH